MCPADELPFLLIVASTILDALTKRPIDVHSTKYTAVAKSLSIDELLYFTYGLKSLWEAAHSSHFHLHAFRQEKKPGGTTHGALLHFNVC